MCFVQNSSIKEFFTRLSLKSSNERKQMRYFGNTITGLVSMLFAAALLSGSCFAGVWTTYTDASFVSGLAVDGNDLWAGTRGGVILWDIPSQTYQKYTTTEGLADQNVKEVFIDDTGNIWFGTTEGVQCYDGSTWTVYNTTNSPLPHNTVFSIVQDQNTSMWFGTGFGCAKFTDPAWEVFTDLGGGATNVAVRGMGVDSQNQIWTANNPDNYGDPGGISMYDNISTWVHHDPDPSSIGQYFLSLTVDCRDSVWAGSWTNYVFLYNGSSWTHYDDGNSSLLGNNIEAFEVEPDSTVWISNHPASATPSNAGVARYDNGSWSILTPATSGLPDPYVYAIANADGVTWFGTRSYGTAGYDGSTWDYLETANEPHTNYFTSIEYGDVGTSDVCLYFGTDHSGIALFDGSTWSCYTSENSGLIDNNINDVHIADNVLWAGSQFMGVWKYDGTTWTNYNTGNSDLLGDIILSVSSDSQGDLWFGTSGWSGPGGQDGALSRFDGSTWTNYYLNNSGLIDDDGLQVFVDNADTVWIGTEEGISKFYGSTWTDYHTGNSGLIENHVQAIAFDELSGKWIATMGGVSHFSGGTWTSYTTADGLPNNHATDICVSDSGIVWVSTIDGIASFEDGVGWTSCTQTEGLADNEVNAVGMGNGEVVWFGTDDSGLSSYDPVVTGVASRNSADIGNVLQCVASPNPFYSSVLLQYTVPVENNVNILIFDMSGRIIRTLVDGNLSAQQHSVIWDGEDSRGVPVSRGMYIYRVECGSSIATGKLILLN